MRAERTGGKNGGEKEKKKKRGCNFCSSQSQHHMLYYVLTNDSGEPTASTFIYTLKMEARGSFTQETSTRLNGVNQDHNLNTP